MDAPCGSYRQSVCLCVSIFRAGLTGRVRVCVSPYSVRVLQAECVFVCRPCSVRVLQAECVFVCRPCSVRVLEAECVFVCLHVPCGSYRQRACLCVSMFRAGLTGRVQVLQAECVFVCLHVPCGSYRQSACLCVSDQRPCSVRVLQAECVFVCL